MSKIKPSSVMDRVRKRKRDLVLQVHCGRGPFWEGVKRARTAHGVEPKVGLPPARLLPPRLSLSYPKDHPNRPKGDLKALRAWLKERRRRWAMYIRDAWWRVVPSVYYDAANWDEFTTACVLYEPSELQLEEFAEYGSEVGSEESRPEALPIEWIDSAGHHGIVIEEFYQDLLKELDQRCFKPYGASIWEEISAVYSETDLLAERQTKILKVPTSPFISVSKNTTDDDIARAVRHLRATQDKNPGGRPTRDKLLAVKIAALYRDHNFQLQEDKRRWRYTYESLVEEFDLDEAAKLRTVDKENIQERKRRKAIGKEYLRLGDELRNEHKHNRGI